ATFDPAFQHGLATNVNCFAANGDFGSTSFAKGHKDSNLFPTPVVGYPSTSPYVVAVGGTQVQDGWTWDPTSNDAFTATGAFNPAYWNSIPSGSSEAVWNESFAPIGTGGGASVIYGRPSWQQGVAPALGNHRLVPATAWDAAGNGGGGAYITGHPGVHAGDTPRGLKVFRGAPRAPPAA